LCCGGYAGDGWPRLLLLGLLLVGLLLVGLLLVGRLLVGMLLVGWRVLLLVGHV
jgi:hypothetical protein